MPGPEPKGIQHILVSDREKAGEGVSRRPGEEIHDIEETVYMYSRW